MILLPVSHQKQRRQSDCLVACAAMVLQYLQIISLAEFETAWIEQDYLYAIIGLERF